MEEKEKTLSFNEYQKEAGELISEEGRKDLLLNGVLGLAGEAGECADLLKKARFQGHTFDNEKMKEELGDVLWYIAETCDGLGIRLEEVAQGNLDKLHKRYHGSKFNSEYSIHRKEEDK